MSLRTVRRAVITLAIVGGLSGAMAGPGLAQDLPSQSQACNEGTEHAHGSITDPTNPAHERIPEEEDSACSHQTGP